MRKIYQVVDKVHIRHAANLHRHDIDILESCAHCLVRIVENFVSCPETLHLLAQHHCPDVRTAVVDNRHTDAKTLLVLANDRHVDVRFALAENHNLPVHVLAILADDENPYVASRAQKTINRLKGSELHTPDFGSRRAAAGKMLLA